MVKEFGLGIEREAIPVYKQGNYWVTKGYFRPSAQNITELAIDNYGSRDYGIKLRDKVIASWHNDGSVNGIELQTGKAGAKSDWKNKKISRAVAELRYAEKQVLKQMPERKKVIMPFGSMGDEDASGRHGSYHFNITLPHEKEKTRENIIKNKNDNLNFINNVQWLEPLFMAKIGGSRPSSFADSGKQTEGSERTAFGWGGALAVSGSAFDRMRGEERSGGASGWWRDKVNPQSIVRTNNYIDIRPRKGGRGYTAGQIEDWVGIEFRFMDTFDSRFLPDYTKAMVLAGVNSGDLSKKAYNNRNVGEAMARVMEEGYNAYVPSEYVQELSSALGLNFTEKELKIRRANDIADVVVKKLFEKNKNNADYKLFTGEENPVEPELFNINKASFDYHYRRKLRNDSVLKEKHKVLIRGLAMINTSTSGGWIASGSQAGGIKDLLERFVGKEVSAEDTRDFIDFCEAYGFMDVKRNPDGSINAVKLLYDSADAGASRFDAVVADESFYSGLVDEPVLDNYEADVGLERDIFSGVSRSVGVSRSSGRVESRERYLAALPRAKQRWEEYTNTLVIDNGTPLTWTIWDRRFKSVVEKIDELLNPINYQDESAERLGKRYRYVTTLISHLKQDIRNVMSGNVSARRNFRKAGLVKPVKVRKYVRGGK